MKVLHIATKTRVHVNYEYMSKSSILLKVRD